MRSVDPSEARSFLGSGGVTPHNHALRIMSRMRCTAYRGVRARPDPGADWRRPRAGESARAEDGPPAQADAAPAARGDQASCRRLGIACRHWPQLQCQRCDDFPADAIVNHGTRHRAGRAGTCQVGLMVWHMSQLPHHQRAARAARHRGWCRRISGRRVCLTVRLTLAWP
jgi:hypothetical protein